MNAPIRPLHLVLSTALLAAGCAAQSSAEPVAAPPPAAASSGGTATIVVAAGPPQQTAAPQTVIVQPQQQPVAAANVNAVSLGAPAPAVSPLLIGGGASNFGSIALSSGFLPDPASANVISGGSLDASAMNLGGQSCRGHVTRQPDFIVRMNTPAPFLRFYVRANSDTTLIVNDGAGRWHCDDDSGGSLNPMLDIQNAPAGQYDVWVGSYHAGENAHAILHVTELPGNRP